VVVKERAALSVHKPMHGSMNLQELVTSALVTWDRHRWYKAEQGQTTSATSKLIRRPCFNQADSEGLHTLKFVGCMEKSIASSLTATLNQMCMIIQQQRKEGYHK